MAVHQVDAIIFDLDGVVTNTAKVHALAWKALFDAFLNRRQEHGKTTFPPFRIVDDYVSYVDGKPRYEGVRSFLEARGILIPMGDSADSPDRETICGLGNRKNELFRDTLERDGVEVFPGTVQLIQESKTEQIKTAIVSSSKNCLLVLQKAGLEHAFDARVDGVLSQSLGLKGKPHPDIFIKAAEELGVAVARTVVIEDSIAGVAAGKAGNFGMVIGIDRTGNTRDLQAKGADRVVRDLNQISLADIDLWLSQHESDIPSALTRMDEIAARLSHKRAAVFLDYDGTLTPIVEYPDHAFMSDEMREAVRRLADITPVALVSGRDRNKVREFVKLGHLVYAGSHGFDIAGPNQVRIQYEGGNRFLPALDKAQKEISEAIKGIQGSLVERTAFSISVHYRRVKKTQVPQVRQLVDEILRTNTELRMTHGKKVFELRPNIDWDKGKAVMWILKALKLDRPDVVPIYLGDDTTDEDAFRALPERGIGILVSKLPRPTHATYILSNPDSVKEFLLRLTTLLETKHQ